MKIVKSLEESGSLIKGVSETIKTEAKEHKGGGGGGGSWKVIRNSSC